MTEHFCALQPVWRLAALSRGMSAGEGCTDILSCSHNSNDHDMLEQHPTKAQVDSLLLLLACTGFLRRG